jgi:hypothetical protein
MRQIEFLSFVLQRLEHLAIPYLVVGSYASTAWGEPRMTRDIDIVIELTSDQINPLCDSFPADEFYVSRLAAHEALRFRTQFNLIHPSSGNKVDFMTPTRSDWAASQLARREQVEFAPGVFGYVAAPEDVILGKLIYFQNGLSEKHLRDIRGIVKVSGDRLDREYLAARSLELGVSDVWQSLIGG